MPDAVNHAPTGTVTFLFTDIEGSTVRWDAYHQAMQAAVRRHDELLRGAIERNGGFVFKTIGDAFCAAFPSASEALAATLEAQRAIASEDWSAVGGLRVRMAIHTGVADERDNDYFGPTVNRVARLLAIGHGGQVLVSGAAKALVEARLTPGSSLLDLGMHRLKDLSAPEHVFQLAASELAVEFPPLRSLDAFPNNLPAQLSPLIGRDEQVAEISELLKSSRLVTLLGPGGIGKTRISLQVAADLAHDDGAWFVDLASYDDPALLPGAIASVLNVADDGSERPIDRLAAALKTKKMLIVLDNCEHLIAAAAEAAEHLLQSCPDLQIIATSREALGIRGEAIYRMPMLAVPSEDVSLTADRAIEYGAVALFVARARAVQQNFALTDQNAALVADIVRRLDGIALAIELAAARVKVLNLSQLAQRLDDRLKLLTGGSRTALPRQQTLRALIAWSYDLLNELERSVLRQVAIFRGSWTLEAAEAVWQDESDSGGDILDLVSALVDKSLLVVESDDDEQRYRLLESTREFALEKLDEVGEREATAARHCEYFAELAQSRAAAYWRMDSQLWLRETRRDLENYRGAITCAFAAGDGAQVAAKLISDLRWFWQVAARREGRALAAHAIESLVEAASSPALGLAFLTASYLADTGAQAIQPATDALRLLGASGDPVARAEAMSVLAQASGNTGDFVKAVEVTEQAIAAARAAGAIRLVGSLLSSEAYWLTSAGDVERAQQCFDEATPIIRRSNDRPALARMQAIRAEFLFADGKAAEALEFARESESISRDRGDELWLCTMLLNIAAYLIALGGLHEAWSSAREALDLANRRDDAFYAAVAVGHLARIAAETNEAALAARLLGFLRATYDRAGTVLEPTEQRSYDRSLELIRAALPEDRVTELMAEGAAMDLETAVAEALAIPQPADPESSDPEQTVVERA